MTAIQSTESRTRRRPGGGWTRPGVRLAAIGALIVLASLFMPWYGVHVQAFQVISESAFGTFGGAVLALLLTTGAALYLAFRAAAGYVPPRPLSTGGVIIAAGVWSCALVGLLALDRPEQILGNHDVDVHFGLFVGLGGALAMVVGGLRIRVRKSPQK